MYMYTEQNKFIICILCCHQQTNQPIHNQSYLRPLVLAFTYAHSQFSIHYTTRLIFSFASVEPGMEETETSETEGE